MSSKNDFDFLLGRWSVHNRKLKQRLSDCQDWDEFKAVLTVQPILNGFGNIDEFQMLDSDFKGTTLRIFNPADRQWSLYWVDSSQLVLQPPVVGRFEQGAGLFYSHETWEGVPVLVRFRWTDITPASARWDQAFSTDEGETWETNWVMLFTRISDDS